MQRIESVVSNTMIDSQGERMTREALCGLVASLTRQIVPMGVEHDPRVAPIGRVVSGFVRDREDGESEAVIVCEIFESEADLGIAAADDRLLAIHDDLAPGKLELSYDFTYRHEDDQEDIAAIAAVFDSRADYELKKSADPISVLTIAGAFVLGGIATGFLNAVGTDGWGKVKQRLSALSKRSDYRPGEQLLVFRSVVREPSGRSVEANTILTNPTDDQVDEFLESGIEQVDYLVAQAMSASSDLRQLVMSSDGRNVQIEFGVRKDAVPLRLEGLGEVTSEGIELDPSR